MSIPDLRELNSVLCVAFLLKYQSNPITHMRLVIF